MWLLAAFSSRALHFDRKTRRGTDDFIVVKMTGTTQNVAWKGRVGWCQWRVPHYPMHPRKLTWNLKWTLEEKEIPVGNHHYRGCTLPEIPKPISRDWFLWDFLEPWGILRFKTGRFDLDNHTRMFPQIVYKSVSKNQHYSLFESCYFSEILSQFR